VVYSVVYAIENCYKEKKPFPQFCGKGHLYIAIKIPLKIAV
jgi:hypothetical protein